MLNQKLSVLAIGVAMALNAHAASFDCSKASTYVEKEICNNERLSTLDEILAENYKFMLAANIGEGAVKDLRQTQKQWLKQRNRCATSDCIENAYLTRIDAVCDYPVISGIHPACTYADDIAEKDQDTDHTPQQVVNNPLPQTNTGQIPAATTKLGGLADLHKKTEPAGPLLTKDQYFAQIKEIIIGRLREPVTPKSREYLYQRAEKKLPFQDVTNTQDRKKIAEILRSDYGIEVDVDNLWRTGSPRPSEPSNQKEHDLNEAFLATHRTLPSVSQIRALLFYQDYYAAMKIDSPLSLRRINEGIGGQSRGIDEYLHRYSSPAYAPLVQFISDYNNFLETIYTEALPQILALSSQSDTTRDQLRAEYKVFREKPFEGTMPDKMCVSVVMGGLKNINHATNIADAHCSQLAKYFEESIFNSGCDVTNILDLMVENPVPIAGQVFPLQWISLDDVITSVEPFRASSRVVLTTCKF